MGLTLLRTILIGAALLAIVESPSAVRAAHQEDATAQRTEARKWLYDGVQAFKNGQIDEAIHDFQNAKNLDPLLLNAQLYLATAHSAQYIPGDPSPENAQHADQALQEFRSILGTHPDNLSAIDGAGSILYNLASKPFDPEKMEESKSYHQRHSELRPDDPEPYYWVGVIDWSLAFRGNREMRAVSAEIWRDHWRRDCKYEESDGPSSRLLRRNGISQPSLSAESRHGTDCWRAAK